MCGWTREAGLDRLLGEQAGGDHHARVRGVGARRDRRDQHVAVADRAVAARAAARARRFGERGRERRLVGVHLVDEARRARLDRGRARHVGGGIVGARRARLRWARTWWRVSRWPAGWLKPFSAGGLLNSDVNCSLTWPISIRSCGRFGPGQARRDGAEVEADDLAVVDLAGARHAVQALRLEVGLEELDLARRAAGALEVLDRLVVDREEAHRRAVLGRHVGHRRAVGHRQALGAGAEELDELADHLLAAQDLGHREHEVGRGHAFAQAAAELEADDVGRQEVDRLAEHRRLGLDAADAPADDADAVDHRRVAVGADERVGVVDRRRAFGRRRALVDAAREVLEVDLVDDAEARAGRRRRCRTPACPTS